MPYQLVIRHISDDSFQRVIATRDTERELGRIEDGANINLDHAHYYTLIEEVKDEER
jgi:hypothetical protein